MSRFLAIAEESYDRSTIYGIFDTAAEASANLDRRIAEMAADDDHEDSWGDMGADRATIQEWAGPDYVRSWHRNRAPSEWLLKPYR